MTLNKRVCKICGANHQEADFSINANGYHHAYCKMCDNNRAKHYRQQLYPQRHIISRLRHRCKIKNLEFNLEESDIIIPSHCPILDIPLKYNTHISDDSVSVDRINPNLGYIKGNIMIMSMRANRIKTDATLAELELVVAFLKQQEN